jgi:hypothetical protein
MFSELYSAHAIDFPASPGQFNLMPEASRFSLNSDIEFTENPISFGIDTLKREVSTSPKLDLL